MQQGSDYNSSYYQYHHPPHLNDLQHQPNPSPTTSTYASAPPFTSPPQDYPNFPSNYPSYSQNPDHIPTLPPTAPSHTNPQNPNNNNNNYQSFIPSPRTSHHPSPFSSFNPTPEPPAPAPAPAPAPYSAQQPPPYYSPYEQTYAPAPPQPTSIPTNNPTTNPNLPFSNSYPNSYGGPPVYEPPYESRGGNNNYLDESLARYGGVQQQQQQQQTQPQEPVYNRSRSDAGYLYDRSSIQDDLYGGGGGGGQNAYAYDGGKVEPYGARGTGGKSGSSFSAAFDDYGRSLTGPAKENVSLNKVLKAVPKVETQQDVKNGVQKFRVKLLAESGGQSPMDVLCQIGLDGIRMLDPSSGRTLRIYPLETITRSEVLDSSIFAFWSKSTVDIEPRRIRLKSSSYTTNTILDTVTAATIQLKEIGGDSLRSRQSDSGKQSEQLAEKKKGFDWVNLIKPGNEEKDHWVPDEAVTKCTSCGTDFGAFVRKHHCRNCGDIFCDKCTHGRIALTAEENAQQVRVCDRCLAEVTQRLSNVKESASKPALCSHEDLAKKLQDEMEKNRKASSGSKSSDGSGRRMKEVACPTCTVHLQVQVPSSGSETIECGVCQHPFLVSAH